MKKINFGIILAFVLAVSLSSCRDLSTSSKVLINEVMMENETNATDEYGDHSAWIELFVKYYGQIDVAGYILEAQPEGGKAVQYTIPKGDQVTIVPARQHIVLWADGQPNKGVLHTDFTLDPTKTTTIRLYNSNKDLIDEVKIPANTLRADQSYGRIDQLATERGMENWEVKDSSDGNSDTYVTPNTSNRVNDVNQKMVTFAEKDPAGVGMAITAMTVVFSCLILLFFAFSLQAKISLNMAKKNEQKAQAAKGDTPATKGDSKVSETPGEVFAAIGMALHDMQNDVHDIEDMVLTIHTDPKVEESAWSNKAFAMRQIPVVRK
ncbi:MAG: lamin tail domain-containing protein [Bacteroidaceae bacterium]|nr:lamin tail domain-containing protein [Bacteroidaceae bacterium]